MPLVRVFWLACLLFEMAISHLSFTTFLVVIFCCRFVMSWFPVLGEVVAGDHEAILARLGCGQGAGEADRGLRRWL